MRRFMMMAAVLVLGLSTNAAAQDRKPDADTLKLGQRVFLLCRACHTIGKDEGNRVGPNLYGVFGAKAGSKPDFHYSEAVKKSGVVWTEDSLDKWLTSPTTFIPGTRMTFAGVHDPEERKAVIAYLKQAAGGN
jgi:cytochrome c